EMPLVATRRLVLVALASLPLLSACGSDMPTQCLELPCPEPLAITAHVVDGTSGQPITNATLHVSGATTATLPCSSTCVVPGTAGVYEIVVEAPGYESKTLSVTVAGTSPPACGCPSVTMVETTLVLTKAPS